MRRRARRCRHHGTSPAARDDGTIQLAEEKLAVGKRVVNRGGTRIRRFVVETPVEQQRHACTSETVTLERARSTDGRPVTDAASRTRRSR